MSEVRLLYPIRRPARVLGDSGTWYRVDRTGRVMVDEDDVGAFLREGYVRDPAPQAVNPEYGGQDSFQLIGPDLEVAAAAGSDTSGDPSFIATAMFNLIGATLTKAANYLGAVIGMFSVTGVKATTYPAGAVLAGIADGVTEADGAVVAFIDGDGSVTTAEAAFKAMSNNSTAGSGFNYGLDLHGPAHDGYNALAILRADLRMSSEVCMLSGSAAPTDGTEGTGAGFAGPGSIYVRRDAANSQLFINANTKASPTWKAVTQAA